MSKPLVMGIDGGGTSTIAWLADADGRILGKGSAGPSNAKAIDPNFARRELGHAIAAARADAGLSDEMIEVACFGLAGFDRPDDRSLLASWCSSEGWSRRIVSVNDGDLVIAAGTPNGAGIALISGTGSIAVGRSSDGRTARSGGWGPLIGDEGSAYAVALQGLRLVSRRFDGRSKRREDDQLTFRLCRAIEVDSPREIVPVLYGPAWDRARIADLARIVVEVAELDAEVVETILKPAAEDLAALVVAVKEEIDWEETDDTTAPPLAIAGGFLLGSAAMHEEVLRLLKGRIGPVSRVDEPVLGAIVLARRALA